MASENSEYHKRLKEKGLKATAQRIFLLKLIEDLGHVDIEVLYRKIKEKIPTISISTVYNNIKMLQRSGVVKEVNISSLRPLYEANTKEHIHLVCKKCKKVIDVDINPDELKKNFSSMLNEKVFCFEINLFFICKDCQKHKIKNLS